MANIIKFSDFLEKKQKSETSKLLKKNGIGEDVNKQNNRGWSPLMRAVLYLEMVKILINAGANLDFQDEDGCIDIDNDMDNILDFTDRCPDKPETINGYRD